jgi:hypothetical protein
MNPWRLAVNVFAVIGIMALIFGSYIWLVGDAIAGGTDTPSIEENLLSPDGHFRAIRVVSSGGGAASWCREFIIVRPSNVPLSAPTYPQANGEVVFGASCDASFTMSWATATQLVVHFKLSSVGLASFEMRPTDKSRNVAVRFEPEA